MSSSDDWRAISLLYRPKFTPVHDRNLHCFFFFSKWTTIFYINTFLTHCYLSIFHDLYISEDWADFYWNLFFFFFFQFVHVTTNLLRSDLDKPDESKNNSSLVSVLTRDNSYLSLRIQNYPICNVVGGNSYVALENTSRFVLTFAARRPTLIYFRF